LRGRTIDDAGVKERGQAARECSRVVVTAEHGPQLLAVHQPVLVDEPKNRDVALGDLNGNVAARLRAIAFIL
jgi:hypothetical protein